VCFHAQKYVLLCLCRKNYILWEISGQRLQQVTLKPKLLYLNELYNAVHRPVAGQRLRDKQIYNRQYWVTALQTNMFSWQQLNYNEEWVFPHGPCWDVISRTVGDGWVSQSVSGVELVGELVSQEFLAPEARGQFRNPEEGECLLLEAIPKRLVKTQQTET
jgi:hypothetical protein